MERWRFSLKELRYNKSMNKQEQIQLLALRINELYQAMKPSADYSLSEHIDNVKLYDDTVDLLVDLTEGEANAFYTDPVLCDDFTAVTGNVLNNVTYNELCEAYGAQTFGD